MRIIAGQHRGLALASVGKGDERAHLRPTSDRVRESLFNILRAYDLPEGAEVLDLFAGTGALGLEALSRGASHATFVDSGRTALRLIRENLDRARRAEDATVIASRADRLPAAKESAMLVFLDPPYGKDLGAAALAEAVRQGWVADNAIIVWEDSSPQTPPAGFTLRDQRRFGDTHVTLLERTQVS